MCVQRRLRSACASAQADLSLRWKPEDNVDPWQCTLFLAKTLIRLDAQADLNLPGLTCNLVGNAVPRFNSEIIQNNGKRRSCVYIMQRCAGWSDLS